METDPASTAPPPEPQQQGCSVTSIVIHLGAIAGCIVGGRIGWSRFGGVGALLGVGGGFLAGAILVFIAVGLVGSLVFGMMWITEAVARRRGKDRSGTPPDGSG